jgi:thiamine biosynthesis lipoprotein
MGTRFELVIAGRSEGQLRAIGEAALEEIEQCHRRLTRFEPDSLLSHIHRTGYDRPVRLDVDTFALFQDALAVQHASSGAFDTDIGGAMDGWIAGEKLQAASTGPAFTLDPATFTIQLLRPDVNLDLGAIAKGHALDLAARVLRENEVTCALLHGGTSSVIAIGAPPDADGWLIRVGRRESAHDIMLRDRALSVSSPAGDGAETSGHIIDPRTGTSVPPTRMVVVSGPSARLADAWSTALVILGDRPTALGEEWVTYFA